MENNYYSLPKLPFDNKALMPYISEEQLKLHYEKHHNAYVNKANEIIKKIESSRQNNQEIDQKATLKALSFNIGGIVLHNLFWENLTPKDKFVNLTKGILFDAISKEFDSFDKFRKEFSDSAVNVEGSGWSALTFDKQTKRLFVMQIEKHNVNLYPNFEILLVLDVWEHAYYLDYKNERAKFVDGFWNIVNWKEVENRYKNAIKK